MISNLRSFVEVVPDDQMRERERLSLNRLPDTSDWEPGNRLTNLLRELNQPICVHRKAWEYGLCIEGLEKLKCVTPEASAISVGAGTEPPLFYYAGRIRRMVATDLYNNPEHEGTPAMLVDPSKFAPLPYHKERLEVYRMPGDKLEFDADTFDFAFCLSSIEHFGSREAQHRSMAEIVRVLKPGGIACIITEVILSPGTHREYFTREEIEEIFERRPETVLVGGDFDMSISESHVRYPVDLDTSRHPGKSPHIVLKRGDLLWTSLSMFLQKKPASESK
jgi:SAM-dependent methyltransferase